MRRALVPGQCTRKQAVVVLSSAEAELAAVTAGACEGIGIREQWGFVNFALPPAALPALILGTDSSSGLCFIKRKGSTRRTRHLDTKVYFLQALACRQGSRFVKVLGAEQWVDCLTKVMSVPASHAVALGIHFLNERP